MAYACAADQLGQTDEGKNVLLAVISYFASIGDRFPPCYGTGYYRVSPTKVRKVPQKSS
jgi:hypothetical protein